MNQKETLEGQKLIAAFMGLVYRTEHHYTGWYKSNKHEKFAFRVCGNDGLDYNSSWNSLMPVFHKIQDIELPQSELVIKELFNMNIIFNNINWLFESCVEYIKWYNENK